MKKYLDKVKGRIGSLQIKFIQIPREENECADRLANQVLSFVQTSSLIDNCTNVQEIGSESNWDHSINLLPKEWDATGREG